MMFTEYSYLRGLYQDFKNKTKKPKEVWIVQNSNAFKTKIDIIEQTLRFQWLEDIVIFENQLKQFPESIIEKLKDKSVLMIKESNSIKDYLENMDDYINKIALLDMNEFGFGLIAKENIKKNEEQLLTYYA